MDSPFTPVAVLLLVSAIAAAGGLGAYWLAIEAEVPDETVTVTLVIDFGYPGAITFVNVTADDATPYGVLAQAASEAGFAVETRYFEEYDALMVVAIDDRSSGDDGRYWQFYVNGEMPMESADRCAVSDGDTVKWAFEVPSWQ